VLAGSRPKLSRTCACGGGEKKKIAVESTGGKEVKRKRDERKKPMKPSVQRYDPYFLVPVVATLIFLVCMLLLE
jgi:hypothetical protein